MRGRPAVRFGLVAAAAALLAAGLAGAGESPSGAAAMERLASTPPVAAALAAVDAGRDELVDAWIRLASIPSSSGRESARAEFLAARMRDAGLESVHKDQAGNVIGVLPGRDRHAKQVVLMAHMDTVALPGADFTISREPGRLTGPGVRDDSAGAAAILAAARLAKAAGVIPPTDVVLVESVREEVGLEGSKAFLETSGKEVGAFIAVDGYLGEISYGATSIVWLKMHFRAPGAHTLRSYTKPSATLAAAEAITAIYALRVPRRPERLESWLNIGMLGGGDVPNAQARDAWFTVDLRSNSVETARTLESKVKDACKRAATQVGVEFEPEVLQRLEGASLPGNRDSKLAHAAQAALDYLNWDGIVPTQQGTADHNIAIQMGIPAIAIGVTTGENTHTPMEFANVDPYPVGVKQIVLLIASPLY